MFLGAKKKKKEYYKAQAFRDRDMNISYHLVSVSHRDGVSHPLGLANVSGIQ